MSTMNVEVEAKAALSYQRQTSFVQQTFSNELLEIAQIKKGQKVLDIGCGCGNISAVISDLVGSKGHVTAIDPNVDRINAAKETFGHKSNISFVNCKSTEFPFDRENRYDVIITNAVLHWIPTAEKIETFERIKMALNKDGIFVGNISFIRSYNLKLATSLLTPEEQKEITSFYHRETYDKLYNLFLDAGFNIVLYKNRFKEFNMGSVENFLDWVTATYYGKFNFHEAFKNSNITEGDFETFENDSGVRHVSKGATFVLKV